MSSSYCVIVRGKVVLKRTVVGFDNLSGSHLQSEVNSICIITIKILLNTIHLTLKMTSAQVVETSVPNNSSFQNYPHHNHTIRTTDTLGFKPFTKIMSNTIVNAA